MDGNRRRILEEPFRTEEIKKGEGSFGKRLQYAEGHSVIAQLHNVLDILLFPATVKCRRPETFT